jgi:hypothetical protein
MEIRAQLGLGSLLFFFYLFFLIFFISKYSLNFSKLFQIYSPSYCEIMNTNFGNITILFISFLLFSFSKTLIFNLGFDLTSSIYYLIILIILIILFNAHT